MAQTLTAASMADPPVQVLTSINSTVLNNLFLLQGCPIKAASDVGRADRALRHLCRSLPPLAELLLLYFSHKQTP